MFLFFVLHFFEEENTTFSPILLHLNFYFLCDLTFDILLFAFDSFAGFSVFMQKREANICQRKIKIKANCLSINQFLFDQFRKERVPLGFFEVEASSLLNNTLLFFQDSFQKEIHESTP